jgi:uncharacterized protein YaaR (DUF327 family)
MERINRFNEADFRNLDRSKRKKNKKKASGVPFNSVLHEIEETSESGSTYSLDVAEDIDHLEDVLDEIHELGEKIKQNPTLESVKQYKTAVRSFLRFVVKKGLSTEKIQLSNFKVLKTKGQRELTIVKIIDEKLERLAATVFQNQRNQFDVLSKIDEIYGLLVDLIQ